MDSPRITYTEQTTVILNSHFTYKLMNAGYSGVSKWMYAKSEYTTMKPSRNILAVRVNMMDADYILTVFHHDR